MILIGRAGALGGVWAGGSRLPPASPRPVDAGQDLVQVGDGYLSESLGPGAVVVAELVEPAVGVAAIGVDHAVCGDDLGDETAQSRRRGILIDVPANAA